jgi:hypothetical protein
LKQGDALKPLLLNFALEYTTRRVQVNQDGWKRNSIHQLLVNADVVDIFGGTVYTIKKNTEASVVASKEMGLEVNANETKNMVMYRDQKAGQSHIIRTENFSFENVRRFGYLGIAVKNKILFRKKLRAD